MKPRFTRVVVACLCVFGLHGLAAAQSLSKLKIAPSAVTGGTAAVGTVNLSQAASAGGFAVALKSSSKDVSVPASVSVPSGSDSATFALGTVPVAKVEAVDIRASVGSHSISASLKLNPPALASLSLASASIVGGQSDTVTVAITGPAPTGGIKVQMTSGSPYVSLPRSVTVPAGQTTVSTSLASQPVASATKAAVKAVLGSSSQTASVELQPAGLAKIAINPSSVVGGSAAAGVVTLTGKSAAKLKVWLSSDSLCVTVPTSVTVSKGASTAAFSVTTTAVSSPVTADISAELESATVSAPLNVGTLNPIVQVNSTQAMLGGDTSYVTVTLTNPAGPGGQTVALSANDSSISLPASASVAAGQSSVQFSITASQVLKQTLVQITASSEGSSQSTVVKVDPAFVLSVTPEEVLGGDPVVGTVKLNGPAPAGGLTFTLSTNSYQPLLSPPASVTIPSGAKQVSFSIPTATTTTSYAIAYIQAANSDGLLSYTFVSVDSSVKLVSIILTKNSVSGGADSALQVTVNVPAPAGGCSVTLSSSAPELAAIPASVVIPAGSYTATAPITTAPVSSFQSVQISASFADSSLSTNLWITKALPGTTFQVLNPTPWNWSSANSTTGSAQGGFVEMNSTLGDVLVQHAALWSGSAASFVDLHPSSWIGSYVAGVSGDYQVGNVYQIQGSGHAALWKGTSASFVDINPPGYDSSAANGMVGSTIVGLSGLGLNTHATLWTDFGANAIDLSQGGGLSSATATDGRSIVGYFGVGNIIGSNAVLWTSLSPDSGVSLHPSGWSASAALGVSGGVQVGWVGNLTWSTGGGMPYPIISGPYAARWSGSSGSFINLDVPGDVFSTANAVSGNVVVGSVTCPGGYGTHAALWLDTPTSFIDLVALAGKSWTNSSALAIYTDSTGITISGYCDDGAVTWHIPASQLPSLYAGLRHKPAHPLP